MKLVVILRRNESVCVFQGDDYDIRTYHDTKWVSTTVSGMQLDAAMNTGFRRLFRYIQGNNQNSEFKSFLPPVMLFILLFVFVPASVVVQVKWPLTPCQTSK